jgi:hypothetical protein
MPTASTLVRTTRSFDDFQTDARAVEITHCGSFLLTHWNAGGLARGAWQETPAGGSVDDLEEDRPDRIWAIGSGLHMSDDDGDRWDERSEGTFYAMAQLRRARHLGNPETGGARIPSPPGAPGILMNSVLNGVQKRPWCGWKALHKRLSLSQF